MQSSFFVVFMFSDSERLRVNLNTNFKLDLDLDLDSISVYIQFLRSPPVLLYKPSKLSGEFGTYMNVEFSTVLAYLSPSRFRNQEDHIDV